MEKGAEGGEKEVGEGEKEGGFEDGGQKRREG